MATETTETKGRILKSAVELFLKFGFRSISMDDISHELGMSKKTLYQYFSDKDEIVTLAVETHLREEKEMLKRLETEVKDAVDFFIRVNNYLLRNIREISSGTIYDLKKYHGQAWDLIDEFRNKIVLKSVSANLRSGIQDGYFRPDISVEIIARLRLEQASLLLNPDVFPKGAFDLAHVSATILDHFVNGIATDTGRKLYKKYKNEEKSMTSIL